MKPRIVLRLDIAGKAEPAGSKKAFVPTDKAGNPYRSKTTGRIVVNVVDDNDKAGPWKQTVANAVRNAWGARPLIEQPLWFRATFYRLRNKGHFGTGKNAAIVKASSPTFPDTTPDALKLMRAVEDALTTVLYVDDAQIVSERIDKRWGVRQHVEIEIGVLPATLADAAGW